MKHILHSYFNLKNISIMTEYEKVLKAAEAELEQAIKLGNKPIIAQAQQKIADIKEQERIKNLPPNLK